MLAIAAIATVAGCAFFSPAAPHKPVRFDAAPSPRRVEKFPNWQLPPAVDFEGLMFGERERTKYEIDEVGPAGGGGTTGANKHSLLFVGMGQVITWKIKATPGDLDGINNAPRKELAAFLIQRLFLDPEDFVVPTTAAYCIDAPIWREEHGAKAKLNVKGLDCALVVASLWLKDITLPDPLYDEQRFLNDPTYAYFLSNFNILTYVIGHRDGRKGNFLVSKNDSMRQVFSIDNGSTFNPWGYNYFVPNWDVIRVAAVRRETIDRLRKLSRPDLDFLLVVSQLEIGSDRIARQVPPGKSLDDEVGALMRGKTIQFGLTTHEIDQVWERIQKLIAQVDSGELPVF